jgi:hypothetical protein
LRCGRPAGGAGLDVYAFCTLLKKDAAAGTQWGVQPRRQ